MTSPRPPVHLQRWLITLLKLKFSERIYFYFVPMQVPTQNVSLSSAVFFLGERSAYKWSVLRPVFPPMPLTCQSLPPYSAIETTNMRQYVKLFPYMKSPGTFIAIILRILSAIIILISVYPISLTNSYSFIDWLLHTLSDFFPSISKFPFSCCCFE